jgi:hypothetical protein
MSKADSPPYWDFSKEMVEVLGTAPRSITFIANYIYHHSSSSLAAQGREQSSGEKFFNKINVISETRSAFLCITKKAAQIKISQKLQKFSYLIADYISIVTQTGQ